jgi:hypothetical protein
MVMPPVGVEGEGRREERKRGEERGRGEGKGRPSLAVFPSRVKAVVPAR